MVHAKVQLMNKKHYFCPKTYFFMFVSYVQDVSDAPAHFDSGNPQYSVRRGLPIIAFFAPIISQGYLEVEKSFAEVLQLGILH